MPERQKPIQAVNHTTIKQKEPKKTTLQRVDMPFTIADEDLCRI